MSNNTAALRELAKFADRVRTLPKIQDEISKQISKRMLQLVRSGFRRETDPYGRPWKAKVKSDGRKVLHGPTGKLRQFKVTQANRHGVKLRAGADYYKYLQGKRHMLPVDGKMPREWTRSFRAIAQKVFRKHFGHR